MHPVVDHYESHDMKCVTSKSLKWHSYIEVELIKKKELYTCPNNITWGFVVSTELVGLVNCQNNRIGLLTTMLLE